MKADSGLAEVVNEINAGQPPAKNWATTLRNLPPAKTPPPTPAPAAWEDSALLATVKDAAAQTQDRVLASMFGDVVPAQRHDTSTLPGAVDRYLDKILS